MQPAVSLEEKSYATGAAESPAHSALWIETDCEPDDLLALWLLRQRGFAFDTVVVGESTDPGSKARQLRAGLHVSASTPVIIGLASDKVHPTDPALESAGAVSESEQRPDEHLQAATEQDLSQYVGRLLRYLSDVEEPVLVLLKPPRELMYIVSDPDRHGQLLTLLRQRALVYLYGSFNLRTLKCVDTQLLHALLQSFSTVYLFETFHCVGTRNSINRETMPELYKRWTDLQRCDDKPMRHLASWMRVWNAHIVAEQRPWMDSSETARKIVTNVEAHAEFQFVAADMVVALCVGERHLLDVYAPETGLSWNTSGYSVLCAESETRVRLVQQLRWDDLENRMCICLDGVIRSLTLQCQVCELRYPTLCIDQAQGCDAWIEEYKLDDYDRAWHYDQEAAYIALGMELSEEQKVEQQGKLAHYRQLQADKRQQYSNARVYSVHASYGSCFDSFGKSVAFLKSEEALQAWTGSTSACSPVCDRCILHAFKQQWLLCGGDFTHLPPDLYVAFEGAVPMSEDDVEHYEQKLSRL